MAGSRRICVRRPCRPGCLWQLLRQQDGGPGLCCHGTSGFFVVDIRRSEAFSFLVAGHDV
jgi:hypothetical protein